VAASRIRAGHHASPSDSGRNTRKLLPAREIEELLANGAEFTEEPTERFYGTDCGPRDPFGNPLRIGTPKEGTVDFPEPGRVSAGDWS
jgi:hypothetical protein